MTGCSNLILQCYTQIIVVDNNLSWVLLLSGKEFALHVIMQVLRVECIDLCFHAEYCMETDPVRKSHDGQLPYVCLYVCMQQRQPVGGSIYLRTSDRIGTE